MSDSEIEEVGATAAHAAADQEPQDVSEDDDGDTKVGAVAHDETEAGAVTPIYDDPAEQDDIMQLDAVVHGIRVLIVPLQQMRSCTLM